jgi:hypothetical protein
MRWVYSSCDYGILWTKAIRQSEILKSFLSLLPTGQKVTRITPGAERYRFDNVKESVVAVSNNRSSQEKILNDTDYTTNENSIYRQ